MKKTLLLPACSLFMAIVVNSQEQVPPTPPAPPPPPKIEVVKFNPPVIVQDEEVQEFYSRNPNVSRVAWKSSDKIIVTLADKKTKEVYDLTKQNEKDAFKAKYGDLPSAPPPPPAPPTIEVVKFAPPVIVKDEEVQEFYSRNPNVSGMSRKSPDKITITLTDKTKEVYDLTKQSDKDAFKAKYGEIPSMPPPPPPPAPPAKPKKVVAPSEKNRS